jgi:RimJ/RimL family protein N-acetyltransferase
MPGGGEEEMIELRGERVVLRTLEREHCRELLESYEPEELLPTEPLNPGPSAEGADRWFEEMQAKQGKEQVYLGVFTLEGRLVGDIQLADIDWRPRTASIGAGIARRADRRQGYGLDAVLVLLQYGFEELDLYRVTARTVQCNEGAMRILEKVGFVQEGCEREVIYCAGRRWDRLSYGLLRREFRGR